MRADTRARLTPCRRARGKLMAMRLLLLAAFLLLAACASPGPYAYATPAPDTAAFLAQGTLAAVATSQQGTRTEYTRQAVAVEQATAQSVNATQAAVAVTQAAATATAATREAATAAAVTVTAQAGATSAAGVAMQTRDAGWEATRRTALNTQATATAIAGAAEQDRAARARADIFGWLGLAALGGLLFVVLRLLYAAAAPRLSEARIIRDGRGNAVALWIGKGEWEPIVEPTPLPALPAPNGDGDYEPPSIVRVNGARRETLFQYDDDLPLHWRDMHVVLTQVQIRELRRWYHEGHVRLRRDSSSAGPGVDKIGLGSGSVYNTLRAVLLGLEYIDESGAWTPRGVIELLQTSPFPASSTTVPPSPSSPSSWSDGDGAAGEAGWGSG